MLTFGSLIRGIFAKFIVSVFSVGRGQRLSSDDSRKQDVGGCKMKIHMTNHHKKGSRQSTPKSRAIGGKELTPGRRAQRM